AWANGPERGHEPSERATEARGPSVAGSRSRASRRMLRDHGRRPAPRLAAERVLRRQFETMATQADVRRIALSLPGVIEGDGHFAFGLEKNGKLKGFAWVWMERAVPKKPRVPRPDVLAVRVRDQAEKAALLAGDPEIFFTEPH